MKYDLFVEAEVHADRNKLSGHIRQRIGRAIHQLAETPRPSRSHLLRTDDLGLPGTIELRRLRVDKWRLIYAVNDVEQWVWVLALRKRPPYDYGDLPELVALIG